MLFKPPILGGESRHISLLEQAGKPLKVVVPYERARKVGVVSPRSEAEINALKARGGR